MNDCGFNFKRNAKVYVVFENKQYNIDISEINFSQTLDEYAYSNKTIQVKNMFEQSVINKVNPANFDITFPVDREEDLKILFSRALDLQSFDLFIKVGLTIYSITTCAIITMAVNIQRDKPLGISVSGTGALLSIVESIPGVIVPRSPTMTYNTSKYINIQLSGFVMPTSISTAALLLENEVTWIPYTDVHGGFMLPKKYVVRSKVFGGSFNTYELSKETFDIGQSILLEVGEESYGVRVTSDSVSYTSRVVTGNIFTQQIDWRMTQNALNLRDVIDWIGIPNINKFIQDNLFLDILDTDDRELVESP